MEVWLYHYRGKCESSKLNTVIFIYVTTAFLAQDWTPLQLDHNIKNASFERIHQCLYNISGSFLFNLRARTEESLSPPVFPFNSFKHVKKASVKIVHHFNHRLHNIRHWTVRSNEQRTTKERHFQTNWTKSGSSQQTTASPNLVCNLLLFTIWPLHTKKESNLP